MVLASQHLALWFDVEEGYNTTFNPNRCNGNELWFDVEEGYNTTNEILEEPYQGLWFDVEERYNTTKMEYMEYDFYKKRKVIPFIG